jgi:anthranilate phosphoribosyltransferase
MKPFLAQLVAGETLSIAQATDAFELIMTGRASAAQIAALLALIAQRGPTVAEIVGAATVMRGKATRVAVPAHLTVIDTCGTGGDHAFTFNISTAAALVAAAAGRPYNVVVAKHGNQSVTSNSGSSQVLEALGVKLQVESQTLTRCLDEAGICFCFAPAHHPAMKFAAPVRAELGFRTLFNIVGPLTNPAGATRQLMGVYHQDLVEPVAQALLELGAEHAMVVHGTLPDRRQGPPRPVGQGHLDELSTCGISQVTQVIAGTLKSYELDPAALGLSYSHPSSLNADNVVESARIIRDVLDGKPGPALDIVVLNAAAALHTAGVGDKLADSLAHATAAARSGAARQALNTLIKLTNA